MRTDRDRRDLFPAVEVCGDPRSPTARDRTLSGFELVIEIVAARRTIVLFHPGRKKRGEDEAPTVKGGRRMDARMSHPPAHRKERGTAQHLKTHEQYFTVVDRATCQHASCPEVERMFTDLLMKVRRFNHNTVHLNTLGAFPMSMCGRGVAWRGRRGKLLILRFTPRGLRRWRLETTRS